MEVYSFFIIVFLTFFLIALTIYSAYTAFGPDSKKLRDPFEEHEK